MNSHTSSPTYLIVCFRFVGDVLITTPLALSIKTAYPDANIDYLVFKGTEKILDKNPHVRKVITMPRKGANIAALFSLFRKYDIAIAAYPSDRTAIAAAIAGKVAVGLTSGHRKEWWKCLMLDIHNVCYDRIHVVPNMLMPLRMLGIDPVPRVVMGYDDNDVDFAQKKVPFKHYIVLHPYSMKEYKYWPAGSWAKLAGLIKEQTGCTAIFTRTRGRKARNICSKSLKLLLRVPKHLNPSSRLINWRQLSKKPRRLSGLTRQLPMLRLPWRFRQLPYSAQH